jgi:hypothetical protein
MKKHLSIGFIVSLFVLHQGCSDAAQETEELIDCAKICQDYDECVDSSLDLSDCTSTCETRSDEDEEYRRTANACEACVDDKACLQSFPCLAECAGVLPPE